MGPTYLSFQQFWQAVYLSLKNRINFAGVPYSLFHNIYIQDSKTLAFFDPFLAGLGRNWVYIACCLAQIAHKPVLTSSYQFSKQTGTKGLPS